MKIGDEPGGGEHGDTQGDDRARGGGHGVGQANLPGFDRCELQVDHGADVFRNNQREAWIREAAVDDVHTKETGINEQEIVNIAHGTLADYDTEDCQIQSHRDDRAKNRIQPDFLKAFDFARIERPHVSHKGVKWVVSSE